MSGSTCRGCGVPLPARTYGDGGTPRGNPRVWCGGACRQKAIRETSGQWTARTADSRPCLYCGTEFQPKRSDALYCCRKHGWLYRSAQQPRPGRRLRPWPCAKCGVEVLTKGTKVHCAACKEDATRATNRRKNVKRRGAAVGLIRYTLKELGDRDGWKCHLCATQVDPTLSGLHEDGPTVDHLVPLSAGGIDELANVALAHRRCNVARGAKGMAQLRLVG